MKITEDTRQLTYRVGAHGSWWGAFALLVVQITLGGARPTGSAPPWLALIIVMLIGTGIAFGTSLSRMRLTGAITSVFETGLKAATALQVNVSAPACVIEVSLDGDIVQVEHAEAIAWDKEMLVGRPLDTLIPDRFLRAHHEGFKRFRESGETRVAGRTISVPVLGADGKEHPVRLTVARLGDTFMGTLVPLGASGLPFEEEDVT